MRLTARPWLLGAMMLPGAAAYFGVQFDVAWHIDRGRDHFDIPPHLVIIAGMQLSGLAFAGLLLAGSRAARHGRPVASPLATRRGIPYSPLALAALACVIAPGVVIGIDEGWHRVFGLDVSAWSPTHLTALYTAAFAGLLMTGYLSAELNHTLPGRAAGSRRGLHPSELWLVYTLGIFGAGLLVLLIEYDFDVPQFDLAFAPPLLCALTAFPVFCGIAALGARFAGTLVGAAIVACKLAVVAGLLLLGRTHPDVPAGIVAGALAADLLVRRSAPAALAAYPLALLGAEWLRLELLDQPQWTGGLWPLGVPLAVPAAMAAGGLGLWAGWALRPVSPPSAVRGPAPIAVRRLLPASLALVLLAVPAAAAAHSGYTRDIVISRLEVAPARPSPGDVLHVRVVAGARTRDGRPAPFLDADRAELGAFRAGTWLEEPLRRTGPRTFEGELRLADAGQWVIWPKWRVGDERWIDRTLLRVEPGAPPGGTRTYVTEIAPEPDPADAPGWLKPLGFLIMAAIWAAVTAIAVRALRLVARFGFAAG
jgi:hypothetical protein